MDFPTASGLRSYSEAVAAAEPEVIVENVPMTNGANMKFITLNRPKALNALNLPMIRQMYSALKEAENDSAFVVVKSNGGKAFCAGGDVVAVTKSVKEKTSIHKDFFIDEYRLNHLIGTLKVPYIAFMDGITMGGGCGISIPGRYRLATDNTMLAMPETALGLFPDVGATYFLSRLKHKNLGMFLALTGYRLKGSDVLHAGLATHMFDFRILEHLTNKTLSSVATQANYDKAVVALDDRLRKRCKQFPPPFTLKPHLEVIERCFEADSVEGIFANLEKENGDFARAQLAELRKMSPTSMKITFRQIKMGAKMSFGEVFPLEYRLCQKVLSQPDFHEGCRAILIDKDRNPKWNPARLEDVSDEKIDWYFAPFENKEDELVLEDRKVQSHL